MSRRNVERGRKVRRTRRKIRGRKMKNRMMMMMMMIKRML